MLVPQPWAGVALTLSIPALDDEPITNARFSCLPDCMRFGGGGGHPNRNHNINHLGFSGLLTVYEPSLTGYQAALTVDGSRK